MSIQFVMKAVIQRSASMNINNRLVGGAVAGILVVAMMLAFVPYASLYYASTHRAARSESLRMDLLHLWRFEFLRSDTITEVGPETQSER